MSGLTTVGLNASSAEGDTVFSNMTALVGAEMRNGAADLTLNYSAAAVAGTADTQALTVSNVSAGTFTANGAETIAITTELVKSTLTNVASSALKTVTVAGAVDLTIGTALTATTINAAAMTGALNVKLGAADQAVTGGSGNDIIDAGTNLTSDDTIVGGDGVDTLKLSVGNATVAVGTSAAKGALFNVSGVEVIDIASTADTAVLDLNNTAGVTTVVAAANQKTVTFTGDAGAQSGTATITFVLNGVTFTTAALTLAGDAAADVAAANSALTTAINSIVGFSASSGATGPVTIVSTIGEAIEIAVTDQTGANAAESAYGAVSFTNLTGQAVDIFSADAVTASLKDASGAADSLSINLKTLAADKGFNHAIGTVTANNIETINLSATGMTDGKIKTVAALTGNAMKTLNISGDSDLTISAFTSSAALTTIDGSTATGDLTLAAAPAAKDQSIKTGSGNDTIIMGAFLTAGDTIDGGGNSTTAGTSTMGKDKLTATGNIGTITAPSALKIANVETIEIATGGAAATFIDATGITGAENIAFSATSGTVKITNLAAGTKIGLGETTNRFEGTMDIALADATGAADAISFTTASVDAATTVALTVAAAVETVNIAASTNADNARIATFTNTNNAAKNIVLTAGHADDTVALGTLNAATTNVNASALAAKLTVTTAAAGAVTVSANGAVVNNITTGAGADVITLSGLLGTTAQTINGNAGTDVLNVNLSSPASDFTNVSNIETINLTVGANTQAGFDDATKDNGLNAAKTVNILGGDSLSTFTVGTNAKFDDAEKTIDATGFAGTIDLTLAVNALDADMVIRGGASTKDKVTTSVNASAIEVLKSMTGVETLVVNSVDGGNAGSGVDLVNVTGLTALEVGFTTAGAAETITVNNLASGVAVKATVTNAADNLVINLSDRAAADNALSLELSGTTNLNFDAAGVEILNIKTSTGGNQIDLAGVTATATAGNVAVNVTGAGALTLKALNAQTNVVNASAATGAITLASGDRAATAMTITTGTGNDTVAMRHANDVLNGGLGTDTLTINANLVLGGILVDLSSTTDQVVSFNGNANAAVQVGFENVDLSGITGTFGADITARAAGSTITGTRNNDQITGGAGADTIIGGAGNDLLTGGAGNDTFVFQTTLALNGADTITDFMTGTNVIDFAFGDGGIANLAALRGTGVNVQFGNATGALAINANAGLVVNTTAATGLTAANVVTDFSGVTGNTGIVANDILYYIASNNTDAVVYRLNAAGAGDADKIDNVADVEILAILTGVTVANLGALTAANFADFAAI